MLGPLEDAITDSQAPLSPSQRARIDIAQRNGLRLQKLVNALLDFSRQVHPGPCQQLPLSL